MRTCCTSWAFILVFACGNDPVPTDAGPPGPVVVQTAALWPGSPEPQRVVAIFLDVDGATVAIEDIDTNTEGRAEASMSAGGSLIVLYLYDGTRARAHYYLGVKPGDVIQVDRPYVTPPRIDIQLPLGSSVGLVRFALRSQCGVGSAMNAARIARLHLVPGCTVGDIFVSVSSDVNQDIGSFLVRDVDFTNGPIDLSDEVITPGSTMSVTLQNLVEAPRFAMSTVFIRGEGIPHWLGTGSRGNVFGDPIGSAVSVSAPVPNSVDVEQLLVDTLIWIDGDRRSELHVIESVTSTNDYALDVAALGIPRMLESATLNEAGVITWQQSPGSAEWVRASFQADGIRRVNVARTVHAPHPGVSAITLPRLPDEFADFNPQPDETTEFFVLGISPGGYDALRVGDIYGAPRFDERDTIVDAIGERLITSE